MKKQKASGIRTADADFLFEVSEPIPEILFYRELKDFLEDRFAGSYRMEVPESGTLAVILPPKRFALFLRSVLTAIDGREVLNIAFSREERTLNMHFSFTKSLMPEDTVIPMYVAAMAANFTVRESESGITIGIPLTVYGKERVYAQDSRKLYYALAQTFSE